MGEDAIRDLGIFYMSGISEQVSAHFGTAIELRLSQVESLVDSVPPGRFTGETSMRIGLSYNARFAGFEYLAYYTENGNFHMIYGSQVTADVPESLHRSVQGGRYNACAGKDASGNSVVLMGVPAAYPMEDGNTSIALIAGLPGSYLRDTLENNIQSSIMEYFIIRNDGSIILHNSDAEEDNYFERVEHIYDTCNGKEPVQYAEELREALAEERDYTSEVLINGESWNVYCTSLPNSEWYLILKISHNTLDGTVNLLQKRWSSISIGGCSLIMCALLFVFLGYYRLTRMQVHALDKARKDAERAMLSAERSNRAKNEFLSNMSHDIRTPMNGIMGMTSIAISSLDNPARVRSCLKKIHVSSRHLMGLITDMLDMSRIGNGKLTLNMEPVCLRDIMQNIVTIIQPQVQEKNQHFYVYVHDIHHENVCSDRVRLSQILLNVLGNAVKFTPEGGTIETNLYEEPSPKGEEYIRSHLPNQRVLVMDDDGTAGCLAVSLLESIGLKAESASDIRQAFQMIGECRDKNEPYHMILLDWDMQGEDGLEIAGELSECFGPEMPVVLLTDDEWDELEEEAGETGIRGFISKPLFRSSLYYALRQFTEENVQQQDERPKDLNLEGRRILIAEDNELNWEIASDMLEESGLETEWAENGQICVERFEQSAPGWFDAILMDLRMPVMTGCEASAAIRKLKRADAQTIPIIAVSADAFKEDVQRCLDHGMNAHTAKPFDLEKVLALLRQYLY